MRSTSQLTTRGKWIPVWKTGSDQRSCLILLKTCLKMTMRDLTVMLDHGGLSRQPSPTREPDYTANKVGKTVARPPNCTRTDGDGRAGQMEHGAF
jgi:hypothetical protein